MSTYDTITFEHNDRIALVTINRPDSLNALNQEVMSEVAHVFGEIDRNQGDRRQCADG
jgi:enoyl-CoA hydratase